MILKNPENLNKISGWVCLNSKIFNNGHLKFFLYIFLGPSGLFDSFELL